MKSARVQRLRILPEVQRLLGWIDAIARRAMKIQIYVNPMLRSLFDRRVDIFQFRFLQLQPLGRIVLRPTQVGHG